MLASDAATGVSGGIVELVKKRIPVACTLGPSQAVDQLAEWQELHAQIRSVERIDDGVRLRLPSELYAAAQDLARREEECCRFLAISVGLDGSDSVVEITSDQPEAVPVIDLLAGFSAS